MVWSDSAQRPEPLVRVGDRPRLSRALSVAGLIAIWLAGCSVDRDLVNSLDFKCFENSDCLVGYSCFGAGDGEAGSCGFDGGDVGPGCADNDQDGFFAGDGCASFLVPDCNDNDRLINPDATEDCNGVDDNCDMNTDEGIGPQDCPLQRGICAGATAQCLVGSFQDCAAEGLYGPDFEDVRDADESCDGIDNNCSGGYPLDATAGEIDAQCVCIPGVTGPAECLTDIGICQRGVRFCQDDGSFSACVVTSGGDNCVDDSTCGANGFCIDESLDSREDLFDDCVLDSDPGCVQSVCRNLLGTTPCTGPAECSASEACLEGFCQQLAETDATEACNGLDDNCNGRIDDGANVCGVCPFGMKLLPDPRPGLPFGLCIGQYEASRPDATAGDEGSNTLYAVSREGVLPWTGVDPATADAACRSTAINDLIPGAVVQRRLCQGAELGFACDRGMDTYPYGATFVAGSCNDATLANGVQPTGDLASCCVQVGASADDVVCDLSGNAVEVVTSPFVGGFGGSANTSNTGLLACDVDDLDAPSSFRGFRCCLAANP